MMLKALIFAALAGFSLATAGQAQERQSLGFARMFNNDAIGDGRDRWHTGGYYVANIRAPEWNGALPARFGEVLEYRWRAEIVAPKDLISPAASERRYAGIMGFGVFSHFALGRAEAQVGAELAITGPQTGIGVFQRQVHDIMGLRTPDVLGQQIANKVHPTLRGEIGHTFAFGETGSFRPFVEGQAGIEDFIRIGGDVVIGHFGQGGLFVRDTTTGQRSLGVAGDADSGFAVTLGADTARVFGSDLFVAGDLAQVSDRRDRLRVGVNWRGEDVGVFYGMTYLGEEFEGQSSGQVVGSLRVVMGF